MNYKHLRYFWMVAKQGGVSRASEVLHVTPQTISGQITLLEEHIGKPLFSKAGRSLELTDTGRLVLSYADQIFSLGNELEDTLHSRDADRPTVFKVGISDVVPKSIAYRILNPVLQMGDNVRLLCRENSMENLLAELALNRIDLVLSDMPIPESINVKGFNHMLGESGLSFMAAHPIADRLQGEFPQSMHQQPMLLPSDANMVRSRIDDWMNRVHVRARIIGEFDDSALMKTFGQAAVGIFVIPTAIADEVAAQFDVREIGRTDEVKEQFFAISLERRITHPVIVSITEQARLWLSA